jgi:hypothetical protein
LTSAPFILNHGLYGGADSGREGETMSVSVAAEQQHFTAAELARRFGLPAWRVRRELEVMELAGKLRRGRAGQCLLVYAHQLPAVEAWLRERGFLADGDGPKAA